MLKIKNSEGKVRFILRDEDEEPISIDELILNDKKQRKEKEDGKTATD